MKIKVCGKAHLEGVAKKTGRPYNFNQIHYLGKARGVIGEAALTLALDPDIYSIDLIEVGKEYNVDFDNRGYVFDFSPAKCWTSQPILSHSSECLHSHGAA